MNVLSNIIISMKLFQVCMTHVGIVIKRILRGVEYFGEKCCICYQVSRKILYNASTRGSSGG